MLISAEAKKFFIINTFNSLNDIATIVYSIFSTIGFVTWPPFMYQNYYEGGQLSDKANCEEYAINYCSYVIQGVKSIF